MSVRAQHLTVQLSKRVFESEELGIVRCQDMIHGVDEYNMKPLLILGVSYEQLPIHYRQYKQVGEPICLEAFLTEFWNFKHENPIQADKPITGKPDVLIIDQRLESMLDPAFLDWLVLNGVQYDYSNSKSRKFSAVARQHQNYPEVSIDIHTPTEDVHSETEKYKLTLDNLNNEMKRNQFIYSLISKPLRSLLQSSAWDSNPSLERVIPPTATTCTFVDADAMSRQTQNDLHIYNPFWQKSSNEPFFQYGYLINNFISEQSVTQYDNERELCLALNAIEHQWHNFDESIQLRLKQFKVKGYRHLDGMSQSHYNELLYRTGISDVGHRRDLNSQGKELTDPIRSFVYDISKTNVKDIALLWNTVVPETANCFELVPLLLQKKQKYRVFIAKTAKAQYVFLCCCRYKKSAAFDQGLCHGFKNGNILPMDKEEFSQLVLTALSGVPSVFDGVNYDKAKKFNLFVA